MSQKIDVDNALKQVLNGEVVDWHRSTIPCEKIIDALRTASEGSRVFKAITLINARIDGDILLDEIGDFTSPLRFQLIKCEVLGGFRARSSKWKQLTVAKSKLQFIDLPFSTFESDLAIINTTCSQWLELRDGLFSKSLRLFGSSFKNGNRSQAVSLQESNVGSRLDASNMDIVGECDARRIKVGGDLRLDGTNIQPGHAKNNRALCLTGAEISGQLRLCQNDSRRFEATGKILMDSAKVNSLILKGAKIDGVGAPALVADQITVRELVDISGMSREGGEPFESTGSLRFSSSRIGGQVQLFDAQIESEEWAVVFHGSKIAGDVLIGNEDFETRIQGGFTADVSVIEGRVLFSSLQISSSETAISIRQAEVGREICCYKLDAICAVRFDNSIADGISIEKSRIERNGPMSVTGSMPKNFAHPSDALLELNFVNLRTDFRLESVDIVGGDCRLLGAKIDAGVQFSLVNIETQTELALIAQTAEIGSGFSIAGAANNPSVFGGKLAFMGAKIAGELMIVDAKIGNAEKPANIEMRNISAAALSFLNSELIGEFNVSASCINGDLHFHSSIVRNPGAAAYNLNGVKVDGKLQWATATRLEPVSCEIEGQISADAADVGVLSWHRIRLLKSSDAFFTNMRVRRQIEIEHLEGGEKTNINLSGTSTPLLIDGLDSETDGWGGGRVGLGLDNFQYERLGNPSGRKEDDADVVKEWRRIWLARRYDSRSAQPARHLASVLRKQGLFEASRQILMDAFGSEGRARPTWLGRSFASVFGVCFGHGLSGSKAFVSLLVLWFLGTLGTMYLQKNDYLAPLDGVQQQTSSICAQEIDPGLFAADVMIPLLSLGQEERCAVGKPVNAVSNEGWIILDGQYRLFGTVEIIRFLTALYKVIGWTFISLAIATWSGLFRRGGRE